MNETAKSGVIKINRKKSRSSFFVVMGFIGLLAIHIGFAKTYLMPVADGTFKAPPIVYIHGAFAFLWIVLFFIQSVLIRVNKFNLHKSLGLFSIAIAVGTAVTTPLVGLYSVDKELANGLGDTAISVFLGTITSSVIFLALVIAGYVYRKKKQAHKRLMLLATIVVLWPAWFRFRHYFPSVPRPDIWFALVLADTLIIIAWIWDWWVNKKIHPILLYIGIFIILEQILEVLMFDSPGWRNISTHLYNLFA